MLRTILPLFVVLPLFQVGCSGDASVVISDSSPSAYERDAGSTESSDAQVIGDAHARGDGAANVLVDANSTLPTSCQINDDCKGWNQPETRCINSVCTPPTSALCTHSLTGTPYEYEGNEDSYYCGCEKTNTRLIFKGPDAKSTGSITCPHRCDEAAVPGGGSISACY